MSDETHNHSPSALSFLGWFILLAAVVTGMWKLYEELTVMRASTPATVAEDIKAQGMAIAELKAQIEQWRATSATPDAGNAAALADIKTQLTTIAQRLDTLEATKTQPAATGNTAPVRAFLALQNKVLRGAPYADELDALAQLPELKNDADSITALRNFASQGTPSDLALRQQFNTILDQQSAGASPNLAANVNTRLGGLITVKHHVTEAAGTPLRDLPAGTPIAELVGKVSTLPDETRAPFSDWLGTVAARDKAQQALALLQSKLLPLQ